MKIIALAAALVLAACVTPQEQQEACDNAKAALAWAELAKVAACASGYSEACRLASVAVGSAKQTVDAMCPEGLPPRNLVP